MAEEPDKVARVGADPVSLQALLLLITSLALQPCLQGRVHQRRTHRTHFLT